MVFNNYLELQKWKKQKKALFSILLCACMYADRGEWEDKRTKVFTLYLWFIRLLGPVQHNPNTVDCSRLLVGIKLVYIVVAGIYSTGMYTLLESPICLHFFMLNTVCKFISTASSYKMLVSLNHFQQCCLFFKVLTKGRKMGHKAKRIQHILCQKAR